MKALEKVAEAAACTRTVAWDPEGKKYHTHHGAFRETCELCRALEELRGLEV